MVTLTPLTDGVGVEVTGVSGEVLASPSAAAECGTLVKQYGVVVYRGANINDDDLIALSAQLGEIAIVPTGEHPSPEIQTITLDPGKTSPMLASIRRGNFFWHIDGATERNPQKETFLAAREVDESGEGGTEFVSTFVAYDTLTPDDKALVADLEVVHSFGAAQRLANPDPTDTELALWERVPERVHPLVWTRTDGRKSLLIGATAGEVVGWPSADGRALLDRLLTWATRPDFVVHHDWRMGDLVTWDNTGMLHRAMPFEPTSRRLLHRTTLVGDEPIG
jgi:alpha-ketoglutarate-dependent taurine dioxygenase